MSLKNSKSKKVKEMRVVHTPIAPPEETPLDDYTSKKQKTFKGKRAPVGQSWMVLSINSAEKPLKAAKLIKDGQTDLIERIFCDTIRLTIREKYGI